MEAFWQTVARGEAAAPSDDAQARRVAEALTSAVGAEVYAESIVAEGGALYALARGRDGKVLLAAWPEDRPARAAEALDGDRRTLDLGPATAGAVLAPCSSANAAAVRPLLAWTAPQPVAGRPSFGLGDRLGLATPGHVRAVRGTGYVPMLAQQSIREMTRTGRSPQDVMDDATWGVVQTGFRDGFGADADHLKTDHDIYRCAEVGFTFYTIDPGDHVNNAADTMDGPALASAFDALPWDALESSPAEARAAAGRTAVDLGSGERLALDEPALLRAAVKYGRAVAHTAAMYRYLVDRLGEGGFELEVSVDETDSPTTPAQHLYVASELARLGVRWVSLAPRFVGRFEKGVDYIGDLEDLERTFVRHLAIARALGDYKISLHSGSDKFSVYRMAARHGGERVHVKTAGTSYLEALRVLAERETGLFREILGFARERYDTDKATYHVSADVGKVPAPDGLADAALPALLDDFDARQVLHVTYGSVLTAGEGERFRGRLLDALRTHEAAYEAALARHIGRHLAPFVE
ncbi:MAG: tagaturonate epimerase family protein [Phycisphaerae bacterium]